MGLMDAFNADERVEIKVTDLLELMRTAAKAEYLENGIKAGIPVEELWGIVTGEPVELELPEAMEGCTCTGDACDIHFPEEDEPGVEVMFREVNDVNVVAKEGNIFVVTEKGYECTPDDIKDERAVGKPVKCFEYQVPQGWVDKGYVEEVPEDEGISE